MTDFFTHKNFLLTCLAGALALLPQLGYGQSTTVVISQVYAGGGNTSATYKNDFVELHNLSTTAQSLAGWSLQYGAYNSSSYAVMVNLTGSIPAGGYYLVQGAGSSTGAGAALPTADVTCATDLTVTRAKVALVSSTTALTGACPTTGIIDLLGYGASTNCFETAVAGVGSGNAFALLRANSGCTDTNNNSTDFGTGTPAPRNSATAALVCATSVPAVTGLSPASGPVNTVVTLTGRNFGGTTAVKFNGLAASTFSVTDATTLSATVPAGAGTGPVSVITPVGTATSADAFTVTATPTAFYAKATGDLNLPATFGANTDGSGAAPVDFSAPNTSYTVAGAGRSFAANWVVAGSGSKVVLAEGASLIIPASYTLKGTLDQLATSTLIIKNTSATAYTNLTQGVQDASSTILPSPAPTPCPRGPPCSSKT